MTVVAIVNPAAGGGRAGKRAPAVLSALREAGLVDDVKETRAPGDAIVLARTAARAGATRIVAVGGDGTTHEVLNGIFDDEVKARPSLAMLPLGTGNSFLRDFAITDADAAVAALRRGHTKRVDVVRAEHGRGVLRYLNIFSLGFTADVCTLTNARFKPLGQAGYALATVGSLFGLAPQRFPLRLDDRDVDFRPCTLLSFSNSRFTGGTMEMAPPADPCDGMLDVVRVGPMGRVELVKTFPSIYEGKHLASPKIEHARAKRVELVDARAVDVMVDGEVVELVVRALEVEPGAVEVVL